MIDIARRKCGMNLQHYSLEETAIPKVSIIQNWYTAQYKQNMA